MNTILIRFKKFVERGEQKENLASHRSSKKSVTSCHCPGKSSFIDFTRNQSAYSTPNGRSVGPESVTPVSCFSSYSWLGLTEDSISKGFQPQ